MILKQLIQGIAIGKERFDGVQYEGTMFVAPHSFNDNDWIGVVFSFQV